MRQRKKSIMSEELKQCISDEEKYQFDTFSQEDAWNLGVELVQVCSEMEGPLAVEIEVNGLIVFRYFPVGTEKFMEMWLARKTNTVNTMGKGTLRVFYELQETGEDIEKDWLLPKSDYADCGGGFPIRLKNGCLIGAVAVSGLPHLRDHHALMLGIRRFWAKYKK